MNRLEAINEAYLLATGKSPAPTSGSKYNKLVSLTKKVYNDWQREPGMEWDSLSRDVEAGLVSDTDTYELDDEIQFISKKPNTLVRVETNNGITYFRVVTASELSSYTNSNAVAQISSTEIRFSRPFTVNDSIYGGLIKVPAIIKLDDLDRDQDEILIDNPGWLPAQVATLYAMSDRQLNYLYPDLLEQANELMRGMKLANAPANPSTSTGIDYFAVIGNV